jgi:hypothetical protein
MVPTYKGGVAHEAVGIATGCGPQPSPVLLSPECLAAGRRKRREPRDNAPESWNEAAKAAYGFESVDALAAAWLEWLKKPESVLARKEGAAQPAPAKPASEDRIPPVKLPAVWP